MLSGLVHGVYGQDVGEPEVWFVWEGLRVVVCGIQRCGGAEAGARKGVK